MIDIGPEEIEAVTEVLSSGMLAQGRKVAELETQWAEFCGVKHQNMKSSFEVTP